MKVLILTDGCGWIVDRITDKIVSGVDAEFEVAKYTEITTDAFIGKANSVDLVHYNNWDIGYHLSRLNEIKTPFLYTVRSHRYPSYTKDVAKWATKTLVINPILLDEIPNSVYIPDGTDDMFYQHQKPFVVGYAGFDNEYKGTHLIRQACKELGCEFKHAFNILPQDMVGWYRSLNLYVCASVAEGHSTPVMECMALNVPVATLPVGVPCSLNTNFIEERTVESIKKAIGKFYTRPQVDEFKWSNILPQIEKLYYDTQRQIRA